MPKNKDHDLQFCHRLLFNSWKHPCTHAAERLLLLSVISSKRGGEGWSHETQLWNVPNGAVLLKLN